MANLNNKIQREQNTQIFEDTAIQTYGADGIRMAKELAQSRGDNLNTDMNLIRLINTSDIPEANKNSITKAILSGAGFESETVKNLVPKDTELYQKLFKGNSDYADLKKKLDQYEQERSAAANAGGG